MAVGAKAMSAISAAKQVIAQETADERIPWASKVLQSRVLHVFVTLLGITAYGNLVRRAKLSFPKHRTHSRVQRYHELGGCRGPVGLAAESHNNSGLKVVLASTGQTGTTSVAQALRDLRYRVYHVEEKQTFVVPSMWADVTAETFARTMSRCRVEAFSLEPHFDSLPQLLKASPDVKVILTWRTFDSWRKSSGGYRGLFIPRFFSNRDNRWAFLRLHAAAAAAIFPWLDWWDAATGQIRRFFDRGEEFAGVGQVSFMACLIQTFIRGYDVPRNKIFGRGSFKLGGSEEGFVQHYDDIRQRVPPERLLVFDVKQHGYRELCHFLGVTAPPAGTPFPHPRSKDDWTNDALFVNGPDKYLWTFVLFGSLHVLNFLFFHALCYRLVALLSRWVRGPRTMSLAATTVICLAIVVLTIVRLQRVLYGGAPYVL